MRIYYPGVTRQAILKKLHRLDRELAEASRRLHVPIVLGYFVLGLSVGLFPWFGVWSLVAGWVAAAVWVDWSFDRWETWFDLRLTRRVWTEFLAELERED